MRTVTDNDSAYNEIEDILGRREMAAKEAVILRILGDNASADKQMALYSTLGEDEFAT